MHHKRGESREQCHLFPQAMEDLVEEDSIVRVIDRWASCVDFEALDFDNATLQRRGAPPYHPADLLKLYLWGYLNGVRSSRSLERECKRNVECMWLLGRLAPDHKTIAEFRRGNAKALVATCACFVQFARDMKLIAGSTVAVDGTKVRAVASQKRVLSRRRLQAQAKKNAQDVAEYMKMLDEADGRETDIYRPQEVQAALQHLKTKGAAIEEQLKQLDEAGVDSLVVSEPDAQSMAKGLHGAPGYNVQTAVECDSHLIVHHEVTSDGNDLRQLQPMAEAASAVLQTPCTAITDAGYCNGEQIAALEAQGITTYVADKPPVNNTGLLDRSLFTYDRQSDTYTCPAGNLLTRKRFSANNNAIVYEAKPSDCAGCAMKPRCTQAQKRSVSKSIYEEALAANAQRMREQPQMMDLRRQTVEHPFADLKHRILGNARLLMRGFAGAKAEIGLAVLVYNIKRVFNWKGAAWMRMAMQG
jgi:transposase